MTTQSSMARQKSYITTTLRLLCEVYHRDLNSSLLTVAKQRRNICILSSGQIMPNSLISGDDNRAFVVPHSSIHAVVDQNEVWIVETRIVVQLEYRFYLVLTDQDGNLTSTRVNHNGDTITRAQAMGEWLSDPNQAYRSVQEKVKGFKRSPNNLGEFGNSPSKGASGKLLIGFSSELTQDYLRRCIRNP